MESGLEGRNNYADATEKITQLNVSMESGLEGRNNRVGCWGQTEHGAVSMESGLEGRNNPARTPPTCASCAFSLNGVRPRRPEQFRRTSKPPRKRCPSQWSPA